MRARISPKCAPPARRNWRRPPNKPMPRHNETRPLPYTPEQMFDLVANVEAYPEFLPWVSAIRVRSDSESEMVADMIVGRSEEHTSELQSLMRISYAVFCLKKKK